MPFSFHYLVLFIIALCLSSYAACEATAADISLNLSVESMDSDVTVLITSTGKDLAKLRSLTVELNGKVVSQQLSEVILPGQSSRTHLSVSLPQKTGSYPLITRLEYDNDKVTQSLLTVGYFNIGAERVIKDRTEILIKSLRDRAQVLLLHGPGEEPALVTPQELYVSRHDPTSWGSRYQIHSATPQFRISQSIFAVREQDTADFHATRIDSVRVELARAPRAFSLFNAPLLGVVCVLSYAALVISIRKRQAHPESCALYIPRSCFTVFFLSGALFLSHTLRIIPDLCSTLFQDIHKLPLALRAIVEVFYFDGANYDYFVEYLADPLFAYALLINPWVLKKFIKPEESSDKYWHFSLVLTGQQRNFAQFSKKLCQIGALSLAVKLFYVPLMSSWVINNVIHQRNLAWQFSVSYDAVLDFLLALFILIDTFVFAVGYLVELPQLKNQIRSVEPTILGWTVCLMCYPPFNQFSFSLFDKPLLDHWSEPGETGKTVAKTAIVILWGIYTSASVALGWKASNLTNRGTVDSGPYRLIRHPAYVSKLVLWSIEAAFLGRGNFFYVLTMYTVYILRALTEEWHLSRDPDYVSYKQRVRWRMIPGVW